MLQYPSVNPSTQGSAVLLLANVLQENLDEPILLPLTLAYLVSAHMEVIFPVPNSILAPVDSTYDELLEDLPIATGGISYRPPPGVGEMRQLVESVCLVITDIPEAASAATLSRVPSIQLRRNQRGYVLQPSEFARVRNSALRDDLIRWVQLVNVSITDNDLPLMLDRDRSRNR